MNEYESDRFFPEDFKIASLISRPNRFVVRLLLDGREYGASLPNPGKLGELFIPGAKLYVQAMRSDVKYPYRVIAVESSSGEVVMLDTHTNNRVAEYLIGSSSIPSLKDYKVKKREVTVGHSRFDFLLENESGEEMYCEVKSCTLFGGDLAMFPDAVTSRGRRHVEELAEMSTRGIRTSVLFIVQSAEIKAFSPDYHTDPEFSQTLYENKDKILIIPISAGWDRNLNLIKKHNEIPIFWELYENEGMADRGLYIMLFRMEENLNESFKKGYYLYISYESENLAKRIERHKRKRKRLENLRDRLRNDSILEMTWPIRSYKDEKNGFIDDIKSLDDELIEVTNEYGLFYFEKNPRLTRNFQDLLLRYRMEKPLNRIM